MCFDITLLPIPTWAKYNLEHFDSTHPEYGLNDKGDKCFKIDACIAEALKAVWSAGFKTLGCCCGHGSGSGVISIDLGIWERDYSRGSPDTFPHHCSMCGTLHERPIHDQSN